MGQLSRILKHKSVIILVLLIGLAVIYIVLDRKLVLDRSKTTLGEYDFGPMQTEAVLLVKGTGIRRITDKHTTTELKIIELKQNTGQLALTAGTTIPANEYLEATDNRRVYGLPVPGKSIFGMGTGYKPIGKNEERTVHIMSAKDTKEFWIIPDQFLRGQE